MLRTLEIRTQFLKPDAGGVGCQNRVFLHGFLHLGVERLLGGKILVNCFDDEVGCCDSAAFHVGSQS